MHPSRLPSLRQPPFPVSRLQGVDDQTLLMCRSNFDTLMSGLSVEEVPDFADESLRGKWFGKEILISVFYAMMNNRFIGVARGVQDPHTWS